MDEATELFVRVWSVREAHHGTNHIAVAQSLASLGNLYILRNDMSTAATHLQNAIKANERFTGSESKPLPSITSSILKVHLGRLFQHLGNIEHAKAHYHAAARFFYEHASHPSEFSTSRREFASRAIEAWKYWLSAALSVDGPKDNASNQEKVRQLIIAAAKRGYGNHSLEMAMALKNLSAFYAKNGASTSAEKHLQFACQTLNFHLGANDKRYLRAQRMLQRLQQQQQQS